MNLYQVLERPVVTEKATRLGGEGKYVFQVNRESTKPQVKAAVEKAFPVKVVKVNMMNVPAKVRRMGKHWVTSSGWKKAVVTLKAGYKIEFFEGV
ncbi:MAG: 50S ribosomal protein L23 [Chloroflexota bacterium]